MSKLSAAALYEILEQTVGAPTEKESFMHHIQEALDKGERLEYRFIGNLGFGGKLWIHPHKTPYVTCYQEDETPGRRQLIKAANEEIQALVSA